MKKYTDFVFDREGNAVVGAEVYVRKQSDSTLASLFSDDGVTALANPVTTDTDGEFSFYAADNTYKLQVYVGGVQQNEVNNFQHFDLDETATPQFAGLNIGHATDTTVTRASAGDIAVEGNIVYRAGGTDVPVADGGTGASTAAAAATNLGLGTGDSPQFTAINLGHATDTTIARSGAGDITVEGNAIYRAGGTDVALADGGTGASLADPGADRVMFWDESANAVTWLTMGTNLTITGTTLDASGGGAGGNWQLQFGPLVAEAPSANFATLDTRNGHPVLDFDAGTDESTCFHGVLPADYAGGGINVDIYWTATSATSGDVVWNASIEALAGLDIDADSFATAQAATGTANGTSGILTKTTIAISDGANMDSLAAGGLFRLKIARNADDGADTMTGDAEMLRVMVSEQ
jgi:hypothetical protein